MYWLQSQEQLFNERKLKPDYKDIQKFMLYFAEILQIGVDTGLISLENQIKIAEVISTAIDRRIAKYNNYDDEFLDTSTAMSNCFYVLTLWLANYSNYDNWCYLTNIRKVDDATEMLDKSNDWFITQVSEINSDLDNAYESQRKLGIYNDIYSELKNSVKHLYTYDNPYTKLNLKELHGTNMIGQSHFYVFLNDSDIDSQHNYLDKIRLQVRYFRIESSILCKIDAKSLFKKKREEIDLYSTSKFKQMDDLDQLMEKKKKALYQKFVKDLKHTNDEVALRKKYNKSVQKLEHEWEERLSALEQEDEDDFDLDFSTLSVSSDFFTLYDFMSEYALFKLANDEKIFYPSTIKERRKMISELKIKDSVKIFLDNYSPILDDEEIKYVSQKL